MNTESTFLWALIFQSVFSFGWSAPCCKPCWVRCFSIPRIHWVFFFWTRAVNQWVVADSYWVLSMIDKESNLSFELKRRRQSWFWLINDSHPLRLAPLPQGLTNGVIHLLMSSTFQFHSMAVSKEVIDPSKCLHSAMQIGGVMSCIIGEHKFRST